MTVFDQNARLKVARVDDRYLRLHGTTERLHLGRIEAADFRLQFESDVPAFVDVGCHSQQDADVLEFKAGHLERSGLLVESELRNWELLRDGDLGLLVVRRHDARAGKEFGFAVAVQKADEDMKIARGQNGDLDRKSVV